MNLNIKEKIWYYFIPTFTFSKDIIYNAKYTLQDPPKQRSTPINTQDAINTFDDTPKVIEIYSYDSNTNTYTKLLEREKYVLKLGRSSYNIIRNTAIVNVASFNTFDKGKVYLIKSLYDCTITITSCNKLYTGPLLRLLGRENCSNFTPDSKGQFSIEECTNKYVVNAASTSGFNRCYIKKKDNDSGYECAEQTTNPVTIDKEVACADKPENFIPICIKEGTGKLNTNESLNKVVDAATGAAGLCSSITVENDCVNSYEEETMNRCKYDNGQCLTDSNTVSDISNFKDINIYCSATEYIPSGGGAGGGAQQASNLCPSGNGKKDNTKLTQLSAGKQCSSKPLNTCSDYYGTNAADGNTYRCRAKYETNDFSPEPGNNNNNTYQIKFKQNSKKKQIEIKNMDDTDFRDSPFFYDTDQSSDLQQKIGVNEQSFITINTVYVPSSLNNENAGNLWIRSYIDSSGQTKNIRPMFYLNHKTYFCNLNIKNPVVNECSTVKVFLNHKELSEAINVNIYHKDGTFKDNNGQEIQNPELSNLQNTYSTTNYGSAVGDWDTSYVINGTGLFQDKKIDTDVSSFDTVNMQYASNMFKNADLQANLNLEHWLTDPITCFDFDKDMINTNNKTFIKPKKIDSNCGY